MTDKTKDRFFAACLMMCVLVAGGICAAHAGSVNPNDITLRYWYYENVTNEVLPAVNDVWELHQAGTNIVIVWTDKNHPQPSQDWLDLHYTNAVAWYAAQAQAARNAKLQAIVDSTAGPKIRELEGIVDFFGLVRPVTVEGAIPAINAWIEAKEDAGDWANASKGGRMSSTLLALFSGLKAAGLDAGTINGVWEYMVATGQTD